MNVNLGRLARRRASTRCRQGGMTMIEVLVAVVLLTIGLVGLLGLLATVTKNSSDAQDRNRAAMLANELAAAMWANNSVNVTTGPLLTAYNEWLITANSANAAGKAKGLNLVAQACVVCPPTTALPVGSTAQAATITIQWQAPYKAANTTNGTNVTQEVINTYTTEVVLP
jgi:type IV pilus assembly protein PilV